MCGLVGMAGKLVAVHDKVMKHLLILDSVRGEDSTGIAAVSKFDSTVRVAKHLGDPFQLFQHKRYDDIMSKINKVFIGHNRYATSGGVNRNNAHPFDFDTLVGVHNGTLSSKHKLLDAENFRVDSENLYHHIEQRGLDDALKQLGGGGNAWALVWWDKEEQTLNFLRNLERPLFMCRSVDGNVLFWASESWMLHVALSRNDVKHGDIFMLDPNLLHTIHIDKDGVMSKPVVRKAEAPKPAVTVVVSNGVTTTISGGTAKKDVPLGFSSYNEQLGKAKGLTLEILSKEKDTNGADFVSCFCADHPFDEFRLYMRKNDSFDKWVGEKITGDVNGWCGYINTNKGYYKISPWSAQMAFEKTENKDTNLYPTHNGGWVNKQEWEKMYADCAWCANPLQAGDPNEFTSKGQCLCQDCAKNPEVTQYVNIMH